MHLVQKNALPASIGEQRKGDHGTVPGRLYDSSRAAVADSTRVDSLYPFVSIYSITEVEVRVAM
ncbi:hypothetical protein [Paraburkholderia sp. SOS3]|uniref:hypothetical protein n=1 Tax=Paraburkholderia sp. SOS3 TaxID=1926494 RepID=UPI0012EB1291|nr:hypothetical protein [Paraburkholderia sp. SOS3]